MKKIHIIILVIILISVGIGGFFMLQHLKADSHEPIEVLNRKIKLPEPKYDSSTSIEQALLKRRSVRVYKDEPMALTEISQLLWAAQGITDPRGFRTAPSAGAL